MTLVRTLSALAALTVATLATSAWAAIDDPRGGGHPSSAAEVQLAQATPGNPGMNRMQSVPAAK